MESQDKKDDTPSLNGRIGRLSLLFLGVVGIVFGAAGLLGNDPPPTPDPETQVGVGSAAPEMSVALFDGTEWTLSEHLRTDGRPVVLNFWASWCVPCREEIPELSSFADAHPEIVVVGVAVDDTEEAARALAAELQPTYPVGIDPTDRLQEKFPVFGLPVTFVIDESGIITNQLNGGITRAELEDLLG